MPFPRRTARVAGRGAALTTSKESPMRLPLFLLPRRARSLVMLAAAALAAICFNLVLGSGDALARTGAKPTIVMVHGAFADASGFGAVTSRLQHRGYTVISPANPLRGPASDAAYVASVMKTIDGPIVLVAHSYGGAVITEAANEVGNVKALVYLNALALDEGESNLGITERFPNQFPDTLMPRPFPQADGSQGTDLYVDPARFHSFFAADVPARTAARMASAQRPLSLAAAQEKSTAPAWKTIPSWYLIGRQDEVISPAAQRFMAERANAHTIAINSSHASYISHPAKVTTLILQAARTAR
jgi:pimeloyl-ACP methyl ester carboxylesterase